MKTPEFNHFQHCVFSASPNCRSLLSEDYLSCFPTLWPGSVKQWAFAPHTPPFGKIKNFSFTPLILFIITLFYPVDMDQ